MTLKPKYIPLAVMYAMAEREFGWRHRLLVPKLSLQLGLVLAWETK
jgi:hypothetical protein